MEVFLKNLKTVFEYSDKKKLLKKIPDPNLIKIINLNKLSVDLHLHKKLNYGHILKIWNDSVLKIYLRYQKSRYPEFTIFLDKANIIHAFNIMSHEITYNIVESIHYNNKQPYNNIKHPENIPKFIDVMESCDLSVLKLIKILKKFYYTSAL